MEITHEGVTFRVYDRLYAVSRCGKFLRNFEPYEPTRSHRQGYLQVGRRRLAHRMVATCWCERPERATHVHHINHDKSDNRADNLEWVSPREHMAEKHEGANSRGHTMSEEGKARLRAIRLGSQTSEETKAKQREAMLRQGIKPPPRQAGAVMDDDFKEKCRQNHGKNTACEVDGVVYRSFSEAARQRGEFKLTVRKRCLSINFPNYRIVDPT